MGLNARPHLLQPVAMNINRRHFLKATGLGMGALGLAPELSRGAAASRQASFVVHPPKMHMGMVTYELGQAWDIPTIIKNCEAAQFEGVELRTGHAHKVEVNLTAEERKEVKKRFEDSKVQLFGLGSIFDYHTPDQAKLRRDIEATKEYILLARDVGATGVKVRPNALPKEVPEEKTLAQIGHALGELGDFARDHGQVIRLEVHGGGTSFPPRIKTILDTANHPSVGACWNCNPIRPGRRGLGLQLQPAQGQDLLGAHARPVHRGLPVPQDAHAPQRDQLHGFLPGGDSGQHRPGAGDEVLPGAVAGLPGIALALPPSLVILQKSNQAVWERGCPQPQQHRPRDAAQVFRDPTPCGRAATGDSRAPDMRPGSGLPEVCILEGRRAMLQPCASRILTLPF